MDLALDSFNGTDVELLWSKFKSICKFCIDNFIPNKTKRTQRANPWITRPIIELKRKIKRRKMIQPSNIGAIRQFTNIS